ncbi:MAG: leucine-rich repeat protein [Prevotella sp.]|nr:leucine-rich repeat protein [Prevotella sp.]
MRKKLLIIILLLTAMTVQATDVVVADANGNELTYSYDTADGPATFKAVNTYATDETKAGRIIIADYVTDANNNSHEVKYISGNVGNRSNLVSIVFGQNIVATGGPSGTSASAFEGCSKLVDVTLNAKLTIIGKQSFKNCDRLKSFHVPVGVTSLGDAIFDNCDSLRTFTFAEGSPITVIPYNTFAACVSLEKIKIPDAVTTIGTGVFYYDKSLKEIEFGMGLTDLGNDNSLFDNCPLVKMVFPGTTYPFKRSFNINSSVTLYVHSGLVETYKTTAYTKNYHIMAIGSTTDYDVTTTAGGQLQTMVPEDLAQYTLKLTVTGPLNGIDIDYLHISFPNIQELNLKNARIVSGGDKYHVFDVASNGATSFRNNTTTATEDDVIGYCMFYNMPTLRSLWLPKDAKKIDEGAMSQYPNQRLNLTFIDVPNGVTEIGPYAFNWTGITEMNVPSGVTRLELQTFNCCKKLKKATLPDGITFIGNSCFDECVELEEVNIPTSVTSIGQEAFDNNQKRLSPIAIPNSCTSIGNYAFRNNYVTPSVTFGNSLQTIGSYAFVGCKTIEQAVLPETVTSIGSYAFQNCDSLRSFTFPSLVKQVQNYTLEGCDALKSVTLAQGTTSIGEYAFNGCKSLTDINLAEQTALTTIKACAFSGTALTNPVLPNTITSLSSSIFKSCPELLTVNVPTGIDYVPSGYCMSSPKLHTVQMHDGIRKIYSDAFEGCTALTNIELNDQITSIDYDAFRGTNVAFTKLPDALTYIGGSSFRDTKAMTGTITIPTGVTQIAGEAFYGSGIEGVVLPDGLKTWGNNTFYDCASLKSVLLPATITTIPQGTFYGCKALEQIDLPETVTNIGIGAFNGAGLTSIELPENLNSLGQNAFANCQLRSFRLNDGFTSRDFGGYVLQNCKRLKTAALGRNMDYTTFTDMSAFQGCDSLTLLRLYAANPPKASSAGHFGFRFNCVLEVPEDAVEAYQTTTYIWKQFKEIRGFYTGDELREQDFAVMQSIYDKLDGASWTQAWDLSENKHSAGKWAGVTTQQIGTSTQYAITAIDLSNRGLTGELPTEVLRLKNLQTLNLSDNHLTGNLGELLSSIMADKRAPLTNLNLQGNEFTGDVYAIASQLPQLTKLDVSYNRLTDVSQVIDKTTLTSLSMQMQFVDHQTHQTVQDVDDSLVQDVVVGQPFTLQPTTLFTYRHSNQDFGHSATSLARVYYSDGWHSDWEFNTYDSQLNLGTNSDNYFRGPKNQVAAYSDLESNWRTVLLRFTWEDGDVNADQTVDVTDLQNVVNYALTDRKTSGALFNYSAADKNGDNKINVIDIVGNVNYILAYTAPATSRARMYNKVSSDANNVIALNGNAVVLRNADEVAALQLTVSGAAMHSVTVSPDLRNNFLVEMANSDDGLRIVIYSSTGRKLAPGEHELLSGLPAGATVTHAVLSNISAQRLGVTIEGNVTTGVQFVATESQHTVQEVYDLQGRRLDTDWQSLPSGVYVIRVNGKQYKVKK